MSLMALGNFRKRAQYIVVLAILSMIGIAAPTPTKAATGINGQINFQGRLLNAQGATVPDGFYNIQFKIYQDGDGLSVGDTTGSPAGTLKWTESYTNAAGKGVQVKNGFLSVQLGSVNPFGASIDWNQDTLWLSMNVGSTNASCTPFSSCTPDGEMVPMKRLSSTPYAMNAGQLGGISASGFLKNTTSLQAANLAVQSATAGNVAGLIQGAASQTADIFQVKATGTATPLLAVSSAGDVSLQPVNDALPSFTIKTSTAQNVFTVDGATGRVGINLGGSVLPSLTSTGLEVLGSLKLSGSSSSADVYTTPQGASVATKLNIPSYNPGASSQIIALGVAATADNTAHVLSVFDNRAGSHGSTIAVFSPNETKNFGLSYDGTNTTGYLKNSANTIVLQAGGLDALTADNVSGVGSLTLNGNVAIANTRTLTLGAACGAGQVLGTNGSGVVSCVSTTGVTLVGTVDSQTKNSDGASIVGSTIYLQTADNTNPGLVSTGAQTFAGAKTFNANTVINAATGFTGNLIDTKLAGSSKFSVTEAGNTSVGGTLTVTSNINTGSFYQIAGTTTLTNTALTFSGASVGTIQSAASQSINLNGSTGITIQTNNTTRATFDTTNSLYLGNGATAATPNAFKISGTGSTTSGTAGGTLTIQGGNATVGNASGGDLTLTGGAGIGTGVKGIVNIGASAYTSVTNASCSADCTITQANVDNYGTIIVNSTGTDITMTLPPPTNTSKAGRILYIATASGGQDYTLTANTGTDAVSVAMRQNTTASMIWNGTAWTPGGASNATTLQAVYNNGSNPGTTPEIKLDSIRGTIDIQDADTSIGTDILNVRGSNAGGLGTVLFGVSDTGRVTIQGTSDQYSAFRVLNSTGDYLFNINSSNNYVISNAIRSAGNEIANPGFEAGGSVAGGEEGWFGTAIAHIDNDTANAHNGNYVLRVTANTSNTDVFAGSYYTVVPGDSLFVEGWVKNSAGANGTAGLYVTWYDKDKSILSTSTDYSTLPGTSYIMKKVSATAPANAAYARISATVRAAATTGSFYFDDFYMKRNIETADFTYKNNQNSTAAFRIQSASASNTLFNADTSNNIVKIGDDTGSNTNTTVFVLDSATVDPTTLTNKNGGLFYRSDSNSLKAIVGGAVVDVCTTAVTCSGYSASAGSAVSLQGSSPGTAQTGNFNITGVGMLTQLQTQDNAGSGTQSLVIRTGNAGAGNSGGLTLDVGTATGSLGTITIGHANVQTNMPGKLSIQGSDALSLGKANTVGADGAILFHASGNANTITIKAPSNLASSYALTMPVNMAANGECLKTDSAGTMYFQGCGVGVNFNLQDAYNNSGAPANVTLADSKSFQITAPDTSTADPSIIFNLQCITGCTGTNGSFTVQNSGVDVFSVAPNGAGITLGASTQIGSNLTDATQTNFQLDSYNQSSDAGACSTTVNQGAMYYNTSMGSIRSCINGSWSDVSNPDTLGLLTFGIVPSSGSQPYDLPALVTNGYSGPCKASWASNNSVHIEACTAYSNGRRQTVAATTLTTNSATTNNINLTTTNRWGHICLNSAGQPAFTSTTGTGTPTANLPTFNAFSPILCIADVVGSATTAGLVDDIYDVRTFTSAMKEAVNVSTASQLGMIVDAGTAGAMTPAASASAKLYGVIVATDGATSAGVPNAIVTTVGPAWVKAIAGTAGQFVKTSLTTGYGDTTASIPNNSFYYSVGNTRTSFSTACTSAATCAGSLYVNFIVR